MRLQMESGSALRLPELSTAWLHKPEVLWVWCNHMPVSVQKYSHMDLPATDRETSSVPLSWVNPHRHKDQALLETQCKDCASLGDVNQVTSSPPAGFHWKPALKYFILPTALSHCEAELLQWRSWWKCCNAFFVAATPQTTQGIPKPEWKLT